MTKTTMDEFLAKRGLASPFCDYMLDKLKIPHGLTARKEKELHRNNAKAIEEYAARRGKAIAEYKELLASGKIVEKSSDELRMATAKYGHPDNESTQAARRICAKRGLDWQSYEG